MDYKNKANITLAVVSVGFLISLVLKHYYSASIIVNFFFMILEASLIGGAADWFAVTAIFSKPLGISFHTELVPRNREKLIENLSIMVENELLSKDALKKKVLKLNLADKFIHRLLHRKEEIINKLEKVMTVYMGENAKTKILDFLQNFKSKNLKEWRITSSIKILSKKLQSEGLEDKLIDVVLGEIIKASEEPEVRNYIYHILLKLKDENSNNFFAKLGFSLFEKTDSINLSNASLNFHKQLVLSIKEIKNPQSIERKKIKKELKYVLENVDLYECKLEELKNKLIDEIDIDYIASEFFKEDKISSGENLTYTNIIHNFIHITIDYLIENHGLRKDLDEILRLVICIIVEKYHYFIKSFVGETLNSFDDEKLNDFIQDKVGDDLQWIRINGSVVGGFIGAVMYIFLNVFYAPYVVPIIRNIILK